MNRAEEEDYVEYFSFREMGLSTGRTLSPISFMLIFMYIPNQFLSDSHTQQYHYCLWDTSAERY
jgi:hypothetical protein